MDSAMGLQTSLWRGCPIRRSPDHSLLAAPRGLSQPSTSFIGSRCQGIHRAPFLARRLDLSTPPSRQDQSSLLFTLFACSTTLRLFRYPAATKGTKMGSTSAEPAQQARLKVVDPGYAIGSPWWRMMKSFLSRRLRWPRHSQAAAHAVCQYTKP